MGSRNLIRTDGALFARSWPAIFLNFAAAVLIVAATAKGYSLHSGATTLGSSVNVLGQTLLIAFEVFLGIALCLRLWPRVVIPIAATAFAIFLAIAVWRVTQNHGACGCFGHFAVPPGIVLLLDGFIACGFLALWRRAPIEYATHACHKRLSAVLFPAAGAAVVFSSLNGVYRANAIAEARRGLAFLSDRTVLVKPETWVNRPFPLADYIDIRDQILVGKWRVYVYRSDCGKCADAIAATLRHQRFEKGDYGLAFVEVPPYALSPLFRNRITTHGRLSDNFTWVVDVPLAVDLESGIVTAVAVSST